MSLFKQEQWTKTHKSQRKENASNQSFRGRIPGNRSVANHRPQKPTCSLFLISIYSYTTAICTCPLRNKRNYLPSLADTKSDLHHTKLLTP